MNKTNEQNERAKRTKRTDKTNKTNETNALAHDVRALEQVVQQFLLQLRMQRLNGFHDGPQCLEEPRHCQLDLGDPPGVQIVVALDGRNGPCIRFEQTLAPTCEVGNNGGGVTQMRKVEEHREHRARGMCMCMCTTMQTMTMPMAMAMPMVMVMV